MTFRNEETKTEISIADNLINLPYLNEPEMLTNLQRRFEKSWIYTYTGPILIAINPLDTVIPDTNCEELFGGFIQNIIQPSTTVMEEDLEDVEDDETDIECIGCNVDEEDEDEDEDEDEEEEEDEVDEDE